MNKSGFILWFTCIYLLFFVFISFEIMYFSALVATWWSDSDIFTGKFVPRHSRPRLVWPVQWSRSALFSRGRGIYTRYFGQLRRPDQSDYVIVVSSSVEVKRITCRHGTARPQAISVIFWVRDSWLVESETSLHITTIAAAKHVATERAPTSQDQLPSL